MEIFRYKMLESERTARTAFHMFLKGNCLFRITKTTKPFNTPRLELLMGAYSELAWVY